ncbi:TPA: hypothetical protein PRN96_002806, partial [Staphylococcus aureus]|nr:hypothetical protein [Staphylococcus aureus]
RRRNEEDDEIPVEEKDEHENSDAFKKVKHTPFFLAKRRRDNEENVERTSIEPNDEDAPSLLAKKKNQDKDQTKGKKSLAKHTNKKAVAKKKKKKSKKNKK